MNPSTRIRERALALGFSAVGIARIEPIEASERYRAWLECGHHGEMAWLAAPDHRERRADPTRILANAASMICVALCHPPGHNAERDRRLGRIARYAVGEDYHRVMRDLLAALERFVTEAALPGAHALAYADTGAILERAWAEKAGLGWTGKHSGLLSREIGSYFLLGELLVDRALDSDAPLEREHCGTCTRCITACPTGAIVAPYQVDARLCISYLTIELRGAIPRELRPLVSDWIFGCDLCQEACPWNRFAPPAREARLHARALDGWTLERFLELDAAAFEKLFAQSPIRRAGRDGFLRNVCVALGNRGELGAAPALMRALERDADALVRAHAAWGLGELRRKHRGAPALVAVLETIRVALEQAAGADRDDSVREEASATSGPGA